MSLDETVSRATDGVAGRNPILAGVTIGPQRHGLGGSTPNAPTVPVGGERLPGPGRS